MERRIIIVVSLDDSASVSTKDKAINSNDMSAHDSVALLKYLVIKYAVVYINPPVVS